MPPISSEDIDFKILVKALEDAISSEFGMALKCASEVEFYFAGGEPSKDAMVLALTLGVMRKEGLHITSMEEETGERQYEIALPSLSSASQDATMLKVLKSQLHKVAFSEGVDVLFDAKPFVKQPGCGLHLHVSLHNQSGTNLFKKTIDGEESDLLQQVAAGVLALTPETMYWFTKDASYSRYTSKRNDGVPSDVPMRAFNNAPTHVAWGGNNRTVALRVPASTLNPDSRHLEFRVPGADAPPFEAWAALLCGVYYGLKFNPEPQEKIYGNAYDSQYALPPLPDSIVQAEDFFISGKCYAQVFEAIGFMQ